MREERGCVLRLAGKATVMSYRRNAEKERLVAPEGKASDGGFRALALNGAELPRVLMLTVGFGMIVAAIGLPVVFLAVWFFLRCVVGLYSRMFAKAGAWCRGGEREA